MKFNYFSRLIFSLLLMFAFQINISKAQSNAIKITGVVYSTEGRLLISNLMIVNRTTQQGFFAGANGQFVVSCNKEDTIMIGATGYQFIKICYKDSASKDEYFARLYLNKLMYNLPEATVMAPRDLDAIQRDIEKLGYKKEDYMVSGVDGFSSPITFLYQQFSKRERARRDIAELRNQDSKRDLLKELFRKYVANDVIQLNNNEFDDFINYCNVSDEFLKRSTQYEFILYVKRKFEIYSALKKN